MNKDLNVTDELVRVVESITTKRIIERDTL